jgi:hypothetical protein
MSHVDVILDSCTVFAEDLGMTRSKWQDDRAMHMVVDDWLRTNVAFPGYSIYDKGVWFLRSSDAALFKLTFVGRF